jgi:hypothetical protein
VRSCAQKKLIRDIGICGVGLLAFVKGTLFPFPLARMSMPPPHNKRRRYLQPPPHLPPPSPAVEARVIEFDKKIITAAGDVAAASIISPSTPHSFPRLQTLALYSCCSQMQVGATKRDNT